MTKIAVTAASGALGSSIIEQLIEDIGPDNVIGLARTPAKAEHLGVDLRKGDYSNPEDFKKGLVGVDAVLIVSGMDKPENRIQQHRNVIEGAKYNGVRKIVYTSITGAEEGIAFSPVVKSNRQTEQDVKESGLNYVIGRNGLYLEPDLEYVDEYVKEGGIINCAGEGLTPYTSRTELAYAYTKMLLEDKHNGNTYNLVGNPVNQAKLAEEINKFYGTALKYKEVTAEEYIQTRQAALGEFLGTVIGGIYQGIKDGAFNVNSDYEAAAGRPHKTLTEMIMEFRA